MTAFIELVQREWLIFAAFLIVFLFVWFMVSAVRRNAMFLTNLAYDLPIMGRLSRLSKTFQLQEDGWFSSERRVCSDYFRHYVGYAEKNGTFYDSCKDYLGAAHDTGRKPLSLMGGLVIFTLVFIEAWAIAFVIAPQMGKLMTQEQATYAAFGIALMISVVLVWLTHQVGHELYKNRIFKIATHWWRNDSQENRPSLRKNMNITPENSFFDKDEESYIRILNRTDANANVTSQYRWSIITFGVIAVMSILFFLIRYEAYQELVQDVARGETTFENDFGLSTFGFSEEELNTGFGDTLAQSASPEDCYGPDGLLLPDADVDACLNASEKNINEQVDHALRQAVFVNLFLTTLFFAVQISGVSAGYMFGFAGLNSIEAYKAVHKFDTAAEFEAYYRALKESVMIAANNRLERLRHQMRARPITNPEHDKKLGNAGSRNFQNYAKQYDADKAELARPTLVRTEGTAS